MTQHYLNPKDAGDSRRLPNVETFHVGPATQAEECPTCAMPAFDQSDYEEDHSEHVGWYWQACFPGCVPDGEATGPFMTEEAALADAREGIGGDEEDDTDEPEPEDAEDEPGEEDIFLGEDERSFWYLGKHIAEGEDREEATRALVAWMTKHQYWPNVWFVSDHGNVALISVQECGCYFTEHIGAPCDREVKAANEIADSVNRKGTR